MKYIFFINTDETDKDIVLEYLTEQGIDTLSEVKEYLNRENINFSVYTDPYEALEAYDNEYINCHSHDLMILDLVESDEIINCKNFYILIDKDEMEENEVSNLNDMGSILEVNGYLTENFNDYLVYTKHNELINDLKSDVINLYSYDIIEVNLK